MKVRNSLRSLRARHRDNRLVRRKGRVYIINKTQRRFKARQGKILAEARPQADERGDRISRGFDSCCPARSV